MAAVARDYDMIAMWLLGLATGVFLMIVDELINLSLSCGIHCQYPIPLIGSLSIWDAWSLIFVMLILSVVASLLLLTLRPQSLGEKQ